MLTEVSSARCFGGVQKVYSHESRETGCQMRFGVYFPPGLDPAAVEPPSQRRPLVYFLSGLTCSEQNFIVKSGFQRYAAELGLVVVNPDTSPRGCGVPGEDEQWDFGTGAGFYVDAKVDRWTKNYRMYSYVVAELIPLVEKQFERLLVPGRRAVTGHSMGGHGALVAALKNPGLFRAVGAFSPISHPTGGPWGQKCLAGYLGEENRGEWPDWDATLLVAKYKGPALNLRIDQGLADEYLANQLLTGKLVDACFAAKQPVDYHLHAGYDHGYLFVGSFIGEHLKHLLQFL